MNFKIIFLSIASFISVFVNSQELKTYSPPKELIYSKHNDDFTVQVRKPKGEWQDLFEYNVFVDNDTQSKASFVNFDFSGSVEVKVRLNNGLLQNVRIRPDLQGIKPVVSGNEFVFTLTKPQKLSVEVNGNKRNNLHLIANAIETVLPDSMNYHVLYFGPGIHRPKDLPGEDFVIPSNTYVYIAGGAVLQGRIICNRVENVVISGRGFIDGGLRGVEITHSKNITVDGISIVNPKHYSVYLGGSQNITIRNINAFSMGSWTDGIDMMSCSDVNIDNVFLRTSDDCFAIYAHRWDFYGNSTNINVSNSVLWADVAHPINIGLHGNTSCEGDTIQHISFKNIYILEHDEDDPNYQGAMAICTGDYNIVKNINFEDIRVDEIEEGQLFNLRVVDNPKYCNGPGRSIENVSFKNISYNGNLPNPSVMEGFDRKRQVKNVTFTNLKINNKVVLNADTTILKPGKFVEAIKFVK